MTALLKAIIFLGIGIIIAIVLRMALPSDRGGLSFLYSGTFHVVPFNRVAFWVSLALGAIAATAVMLKGLVQR